MLNKNIIDKHESFKVLPVQNDGGRHFPLVRDKQTTPQPGFKPKVYKTLIFLS